MMRKHFWANKNSLAGATLVLSILCSCEEPVKTLPVLGPYTVTDQVKDGVFRTDTVFTNVRDFTFIDQNADTIDQTDFEGKLYVTDFFFTSCPTICPKMKQQMLRIYEAFKEEPEVLLLSHSIDPKRDSVARLRTYAEKLGIEAYKWHLVTGEKDSIYSMAKHYMIAAQEDALAPGGYAHSGAFLLVDRNKQIRGIYDGTNPDEVDVLIADIKFLLSED
jgi:protein SCO1/2